MSILATGCDGLPAVEVLPTELPPAATREAPMSTPEKPREEPPTTVTSPETPAKTSAAETPPATAIPPAEVKAPVLSTDLKRGCQRGGDGRRSLAVGTLAVDFTLDDTTGQSHTLSALLAKKPVVIVFGSFT